MILSPLDEGRWPKAPAGNPERPGRLPDNLFLEGGIGLSSGSIMLSNIEAKYHNNLLSLINIALFPSRAPRGSGQLRNMLFLTIGMLCIDPSPAWPRVSFRGHPVGKADSPERPNRHRIRGHSRRGFRSTIGVAGGAGM